MSRLFSANVMRLKKSRMFLIIEIFMVGYAFFVYESARSTIATRGMIRDWHTYFFNVLLVSGIVEALFVSVFFNVEYSDGAIRNKLMVGHKRRDIYLVNLATCLLAGLTMYATYCLSALLFGLLFIGRETLQIQNVGAGMLGSILVFIVYTAIFVPVEMLDQNKARSMAINLIGALVILVAGMLCYGELAGNSETAALQWRIIELLFPSVLAMDVATGTEQAAYAAIVLSLVIETACLTGLGVWAFGRKDIQ